MPPTAVPCGFCGIYPVKIVYWKNPQSSENPSSTKFFHFSPFHSAIQARSLQLTTFVFRSNLPFQDQHTTLSPKLPSPLMDPSPSISTLELITGVSFTLTAVHPSAHLSPPIQPSSSISPGERRCCSAFHLKHRGTELNIGSVSELRSLRRTE